MCPVQRYYLAPVSPHPLTPHTSFCPALSSASPLTHHLPSVFPVRSSPPDPWLSPRPPETLALLEITLSPSCGPHHPWVSNCCEKIPSQGTRGVLAGSSQGCSSQCSIVTLGAMHHVSNQVFCANLATQSSVVILCPWESVKVLSNWLRSEYRMSGMGVCPLLINKAVCLTAAESFVCSWRWEKETLRAWNSKSAL